MPRPACSAQLPTACPPGTSSGRPSTTLPSAPPAVIAVQFFYSHIHAPPPPAFALGLVTYLSGFLEAPLCVLSSGGLMDVFQKMVILYDLSWNLF